MEIETDDPAMRDWIPPAAAADEGDRQAASRAAPAAAAAVAANRSCYLGFGGYLPERVVTNAELVEDFPEITAEYVYQVTGIRERRWAADGRKAFDMAYQAGAGGDPPLGHRRQGHRRRDRRHDHARRGHALDGLHSCRIG